MNIIGGEMTNACTIFEKYIKELKLSTLNEYVYIIRDNIFGDVMFSPSSNGISMISCNDIHDKYFNKMYSVNVFKGKTIGYETDIGVIEGFDNIAYFNAVQKFDKDMRIYNCVRNDISTATSVSYINNLNTDEKFYNNILIKKSADGAGKFILDNRVIYVAQTMLPGTKSTPIDAEVYYTNGNDYFTVKFITHKKQNDIYTFMRFLCR